MAFPSCNYWPYVRFLNTVVKNMLGGESARRIAQCLGNLTELYISENFIGREGGLALTRTRLQYKFLCVCNELLIVDLNELDLQTHMELARCHPAMSDYQSST